MCDGLARNLPKEPDTIVANCLAHGRRNFIEIHDRFPAERRHVIEAFKVIYHNDKIAREENMSADERGFLPVSMCPRQALIHDKEPAAHHALIADESIDDSTR